MAEATTEIDDLKDYSDRLARYTAEELEDIYFNIHILRHPLRYRLLMREIERRLMRQAPTEPLRRFDLRAWMESRPWLARHPLIRAICLSAALFGITTGITFGLLAPIWLCAVPLRFIGLETAIVYFACAPVPPILAAGIGGRLGGRGLY